MIFTAIIILESKISRLNPLNQQLQANLVKAINVIHYRYLVFGNSASNLLSADFAQPWKLTCLYSLPGRQTHHRLARTSSEKTARIFA